MKIYEQFIGEEVASPSARNDGDVVLMERRSNLSFEIFPPKHDDPLGDINAVLDVLCELRPDYISVTNGAGGGTNGEKTIAVARMIRERYGVEPLVHLTGWGRTKEEVDEFLSRMLDAGLVNVLALRGDRPAGGRECGVLSDEQRERECGVFSALHSTLNTTLPFPHASDLIRYIRSRDGRFCVAAACYPDGHPESRRREGTGGDDMKRKGTGGDDMKRKGTGLDMDDPDIAYTVLKQQCGAQFFISQLFFDNDNYMRFLDDMAAGGVTAPVCAGIMPVVSRSQIKRMVGMCGAVLPERFHRIIDKYGDDKAAMLDVGVQYAIAQVIDLCARNEECIHLYTMNNPQVARRICEGVRNVIRR